MDQTKQEHKLHTGIKVGHLTKWWAIGYDPGGAATKDHFFSRTFAYFVIIEPLLVITSMWWFYRVLVASLLLGLLSSFRLNVPKFASKGSLRSLKSTPADEQTTDTVAKDVHPPTTGKSFPTPIEKILDEGAEPEKKEIEKFLMLYTCKMCSFRNSNMVRPNLLSSFALLVALNAPTLHLGFQSRILQWDGRFNMQRLSEHALNC